MSATRSPYLAGLRKQNRRRDRARSAGQRLALDTSLVGPDPPPARASGETKFTLAPFGSDASCRNGRPRPTTSTVETSSTRTTRCGTPASAKPIQRSPAAAEMAHVDAHVTDRLEVHFRPRVGDLDRQDPSVGLHREMPAG